MDGGQAMEQAFTRLLGINWKESNYSRRTLYPHLLREWLRRSALWGKALDLITEWPWVDVAERVPGFTPHFAEEIERRITELNAQHSIGLYGRRMCRLYVRWMVARAVDPEWISRYDLPAPYEPLIVMFEEGGTHVWQEAGFIEVCHVGIPIRDWRNYDRDESPLDPALLARLDTSERGP